MSGTPTAATGRMTTSGMMRISRSTWLTSTSAETKSRCGIEDPVEAVHEHDADEERRRERLAQRIAPADRRAAVAAATAQQQPADDGDVVVGADLVAALRAVRAALA